MIKSACRTAYEERFSLENRTNENWTIWRIAWNSALRHASNQNNKEIEFI